MRSFEAAGAQRVPTRRTVSIIIPFFNEAANLPNLVDALDGYIAAAAYRWSIAFELIFVDDGGTDGGLQRLRAYLAARPRDFGARLLRLSRNFGKDAALTAGLAVVESDAVVFMDADLQHPPSVIDAFLTGWIAEGYDVVCAYQDRARPEPWWKRRARSLYRELTRSSAPAPVHPDIGDFRLMSRKAYEALRDLGERQRLMRGLYDWVGFSTKAVAYTAPDRLFGASKFSPLKLVALGVEGITASSVAPLRLAVWAGVSLGVLAGAYGLWTVVETVVVGVGPPGYPTIVCTISMIGAAQLIFLGVIGEYLGKVLAEAKGRPIYVLESDCVLAGAELTSRRTEIGGLVYRLDR